MRKEECELSPETLGNPPQRGNITLPELFLCACGFPRLAEIPVCWIKQFYCPLSDNIHWKKL